jgi:hypothetical protein
MQEVVTFEEILKMHPGKLHQRAKKISVGYYMHSFKRYSN